MINEANQRQSTEFGEISRGQTCCVQSGLLACLSVCLCRSYGQKQTENGKNRKRRWREENSDSHVNILLCHCSFKWTGLTWRKLGISEWSERENGVRGIIVVSVVFVVVCASVWVPGRFGCLLLNTVPWRHTKEYCRHVFMETWINEKINASKFLERKDRTGINGIF